MKSLVIGGCGFIGSHIVDELLSDGQSVAVFDRQPERHRFPLEQVIYMYGNFNDRMAMTEALVGVDIVYHAASTTFPSTANIDPVSDVRDNLVSTLQLLDLMRDMSTKKIVYLSSGGTVYGPPQIIPTPEDHPLQPINSYGIVKATIEHYLMMYRDLYDLPSVSIRASNPYGERQGHSGVQGVISTFLNQTAAGEDLEIWGDGEVVRDYLHVTDLARACILAGKTSYCGPINIGSGEGQSLNDIIDILRTVADQDFKVTYKPARLIDVKRSVLDVSLAKSEFDWSTTIPLREGISKTWNWLNAAKGRKDGSFY